MLIDSTRRKEERNREKERYINSLPPVQGIKPTTVFSVQNHTPTNAATKPGQKFLLFITLFLLLTLLKMSPLSHPTLPTSHQLSPLSPQAVITLSSVSMGYAYVFLGHSFHLLSSSLPSPSPLTAVSLFHVHMPLFLFCSSVYFVHQIPLIIKII